MLCANIKYRYNIFWCWFIHLRSCWSIHFVPSWQTIRKRRFPRFYNKHFPKKKNGKYCDIQSFVMYQHFMLIDIKTLNKLVHYQNLSFTRSGALLTIQSVFRISFVMQNASCLKYNTSHVKRNWKRKCCAKSIACCSVFTLLFLVQEFRFVISHSSL